MALVIILWLCNLYFTPADAAQQLETENNDGMWEIPIWVVIVVVVFMKVVLYDITHIATLCLKNLEGLIKFIVEHYFKNSNMP